MKSHLPSFLRRSASKAGSDATSRGQRPQPPPAGRAQVRASPASPARSEADHLPPPPGASPPLGAARPGPRPAPGTRVAALTSSLCVDGHFFRRRPQLSRFPVCRCRVLARARSAPAARLSVPMAAADGAGPAAAGGEGGPPEAGERSARLLAPRGGTPACARARGRSGDGGAAAGEGRASGCGSSYCGRRGRADSRWSSRFQEDND